MKKFVLMLIEKDQESEEKLQQQAYNKLLAYLFLNRADKARLGKLIEDLANQYAIGYNNYSSDMAAASVMILGYQKD